MVRQAHEQDTDIVLDTVLVRDCVNTSAENTFPYIGASIIETQHKIS